MTSLTHGFEAERRGRLLRLGSGTLRTSETLQKSPLDNTRFRTSIGTDLVVPFGSVQRFQGVIEALRLEDGQRERLNISMGGTLPPCLSTGGDLHRQIVVLDESPVVDRGTQC